VTIFISGHFCGNIQFCSFLGSIRSTFIVNFNIVDIVCDALLSFDICKLIAQVIIGVSDADGDK